ncbi:MAG: two-component sensor histidine kinase [Ectothiorhodospiraceae bacterium]|nr:two-component sensor histidine kinase [Chromatiales bacterium]MCP5153688.1 two-component sensor histidine kinase [Ectothiorhodospiraceae bacterium]
MVGLDEGDAMVVRGRMGSAVLRLQGMTGRWRAAIGASARFDLRRSFAVLGFCSIALMTAVTASVLVRFLGEHLLERDAIVSMEFIQSVARINDPAPYFTGSTRDTDRGQLQEFMEHITRMPNVVRANVYGRDQGIIWSSDASLVGRRLAGNPELEQALAGQVVFKREDLHDESKVEHVYLPEGVHEFIESYVPVLDREGDVVGVIELYKRPSAIDAAMMEGRFLVWTTALVSALVLFLSLYWVVRRGAAIIRSQQERLVRIETMAAVGEMASSVAHSIRNPLAAIRSSAELALESRAVEDTHEAARDVIAEVDRLGEWIRGMLAFSRDEQQPARAVDLGQVVTDCVEGYARTARRQGVEVKLDVSTGRPRVTGDAMLLAQMVNSFLSNAVEAMPDGGRLEVSLAPIARGRAVELRVTDTGPGIPPERQEAVFKPFFTNKVNGLGLGLPLAQRVAERYGGDLMLDSATGRGTTVVVRLPVASP